MKQFNLTRNSFYSNFKFVLFVPCLLGRIADNFQMSSHVVYTLRDVADSDSDIHVISWRCLIRCRFGNLCFLWFHLLFCKDLFLLYFFYYLEKLKFAHHFIFLCVWLHNLKNQYQHWWCTGGLSLLTASVWRYRWNTAYFGIDTYAAINATSYPGSQSIFQQASFCTCYNSDAS